MRKPRGVQIRANRLIGPWEVLGGDDRRVPAKGRGRTAPYRGRSGASWIWSTPLDAGASEGELRSGYALTPSPSHSKNNLSFLQKGRPRKESSQRTATALFFYPSCGDFQLSLREFHLSLIRVYSKTLDFLGATTFTLEPGAHRARFIREFFEEEAPDLAAQLQAMEGVVTVESDQPLAAVTLRQNDDPLLGLPEDVPTLAVFPGIPGRGDEAMAEALSGGWGSTIP